VLDGRDGHVFNNPSLFFNNVALFLNNAAFFFTTETQSLIFFPRREENIPSLGRKNSHVRE
jgi:hypothetical protein